MFARTLTRVLGKPPNKPHSARQRLPISPCHSFLKKRDRWAIGRILTPARHHEKHVRLRRTRAICVFERGRSRYVRPQPPSNLLEYLVMPFEIIPRLLSLEHFPHDDTECVNIDFVAVARFSPSIRYHELGSHVCRLKSEGGKKREVKYTSETR